MERCPSLARRLLFACAVVPVVLSAGLGAHAAAPSHVASAPALAAVNAAPALAAATVVPTAVAGATGAISDTTSGAGGTGTAGFDSTLLQDEQTLLSNPIPDLTSGVPLSKVPPVTGSVAGLETTIAGLLGRLQTSSLSPSARDSVTGQLQNLNARLAPALDLQDKIDSLRGQENALLQARLDGQAAIDKINAQIQINLDSLRVNVESTVNADVTASVGTISITVSGGADTIQAQLGAQVNRLLVNVITDIDVLHIATLHATANVDTARLNVTLFAQVKKLRLDLRLLLTNLKVHVRADVAAAITAEASLTISLAAEVDGLKADLAANIDTKISGLDALLTTLINTLNGDIASASSALQGIRTQVP